jgi:hypothetical protein
LDTQWYDYLLKIIKKSAQICVLSAVSACKKYKHMKSIFITFGQSLNRSVLELLDKLEIRGFTRWEETYGRGSINGEPHYGTHAWPSKNSSILAVVEESKAEMLLEKLRLLNEKAEEQGLSAFVWSIEGRL